MECFLEFSAVRETSRLSDERIHRGLFETIGSSVRVTNFMSPRLRRLQLSFTAIVV